MTPDQLEAIKARAATATEGPWGYDRSSFMAGLYDITVGVGRVFPDISMCAKEPDAEFIARARTDIPALVAEVERLKAAVDAVRELHRKNEPDDGECQGYGDMPGGYGYLDDWCVECSNQSGREYGTTYPCPTIRALDEHLGGGE